MTRKPDPRFGIYCGARRTRGTGLCRAWPVKGKRRCKWHGGRSTGPRDWRGNVAAMAMGRRRWIARRHALGLKASGGRPRKSERVAPLAEQAKESIATGVVLISETLPA